MATILDFAKVEKLLDLANNPTVPWAPTMVPDLLDHLEFFLTLDISKFSISKVVVVDAPSKKKPNKSPKDVLDFTIEELFKGLIRRSILPNYGGNFSQIDQLLDIFKLLPACPARDAKIEEIVMVRRRHADSHADLHANPHANPRANPQNSTCKDFADMCKDLYNTTQFKFCKKLSPELTSQCVKMLQLYELYVKLPTEEQRVCPVNAKNEVPVVGLHPIITEWAFSALCAVAQLPVAPSLVANFPQVNLNACQLKHLKRLKRQYLVPPPVVPAVPAQKCANCNKAETEPGQFEVCTRCLDVEHPYCSRVCQVQHWKSHHKATCIEYRG